MLWLPLVLALQIVTPAFDDREPDLKPEPEDVPAYAATHNGRYWQGIITHSTLPDDGALLSPDLTRRPTDQVERWTDVFFNGRVLPGTNWPVAVRVDVYDGPRGTGWVVSVLYTKAGETWGRSFQYGAETEREQGWARVA